VIATNRYRPTQYFVIHLSTPIEPKKDITLSISYHILAALRPLPAAIKQDDKQYLTYDFSAYFPSAYPTLKQKTKLKLASADIPEYTTTKGLTKSTDPEKQGSTLTYGTYDSTIPPFTTHPVSIRYEFTKPLLHSTTLHHLLEVSHWGGNLATEDHYALTNTGASLSNHFSRVSWATQNFYIQSGQITTPALRQLTFSLPALSSEVYYTDEIGNVSTSRYRPTPPTSPTRAAHLELKPRYPLFGSWNFAFRIGWNNPLSNHVRALTSQSSTYILRAPLLSPPSNAEGLSVGIYTADILLPEGAKILSHQFSTPSGAAIPDFSVTEGVTKTFMDTTLGRTRLSLEARNVVDDLRDVDVLVTYEYTTAAALRKPLSVFAGFVVVFVLAWAVGQVDTSIGKRKAT
jgi:oligosaccharyltransferase complex subunit alpha (ribophorin I)